MKLEYIAESQAEEEILRQLWQLIQSLPTDSGEALPNYASLLYEGRNRLYSIKLRGQTFVVKCFATPKLIPRLYYSLLGQGKAMRSHLHALALTHRGIAVPHSVGYIVERNSLGIMGRSYYVSHALVADVPHLQAHARGWASPPNFMPALAEYLHRCHSLGVEHLDLSPGNILYRYDADCGTYTFAMVDLNRMRLHAKPLPREQALDNLKRLMNTPSASRRLGYYYALSAGWEKETTISELERRTDAFWRQRWLKLSARYAKRCYGMGLGQFMLIYLRYRLALLGEDKTTAEALYRRYLQREDIRHIERRRQGFSYRYT